MIIDFFVCDLLFLFVQKFLQYIKLDSEITNENINKFCYFNGGNNWHLFFFYTNQITTVNALAQVVSLIVNIRWKNMTIKFIADDPDTIEFSLPTRIKYSKLLFYPFPQAPAIFTCLSGLIISCRLRVTDSRQYRRNLRAVTRQNCARRRRRRRRRGRCESATTWRRRFPKHLRIVGFPVVQQTFGYPTLSLGGLTRDPFTVRPIDAALIRPRDYTSRYSNFAREGMRGSKQFSRVKSTMHLDTIKQSAKIERKARKTGSRLFARVSTFYACSVQTFLIGCMKKHS